MEYSGNSPNTAWALPKSHSAGMIAMDAGLDPALDLVEACADFYWLERAASDGMPGANEQLEAVESYIAEQFAIYLDMACGGELRLLPVQSSGPYNDSSNNECIGRWCGLGDACYMCQGFYCFKCGMCHNRKCTANKPKSFEATVKFMKCPTPQGYQCECDDDGPKQKKYGSWADDVHPMLVEFFDTMDYSGSIERHEGWQSWLDFRQQHGLNALRWMVDAFGEGVYWSHSCGGPKWQAAARLLLDYLEGSITPRVMVNMAWSMQHNGGSLFNKVFNVEAAYSDSEYEYDKNGYNKESRPSLHSLLERQSCDDYSYLEKYLSKPIKKFAMYVKMILNTKQGQRHAQETKLYTMVQKSMDYNLPSNKRAHFGSVAHIMAENVHLSE